MKKILAFLLCLGMICSLIGCKEQSSKKEYTPVSGLDTKKEVSLKIATVSETDKALDMVINAFNEKYPNVDIKLEYVEDYNNNALELLKRNEIDILFQKDTVYQDSTQEEDEEGDTQEPWTTDDFYYNFAQDEEIDFSNTTAKLMGNYTHSRVDEDGKEITYQYSVPMGGEVRGLFVNKTFLESLGLKVPENWTEFVNCCASIREQGYIPIQGNAGTAAMAIMLASCVNEVVHDPDSLEAMKEAKSGISQMFEPDFEKLYSLATNRYYDYKYVEEELGQFTGVSDVAQARSFLGLVRDEDTYEYETPKNNYGTVAFFPYLSYLGTTIDTLIDDYNLDTEFTFIITPTADEGNNPTYLTPYYGICANKNSDNLIWVREFVNFFFTDEINRMYAEHASIIPNVTDAVECMAEKYGVNAETDCASCGDIHFSDSYNGFSPLAKVLVNVSKCSARKYMVNLNRDESGNIGYVTDEDGKEYLLTDEGEKIYKEFVGMEDAARPGYAFCNMAYYMEQLESEFAKYRGE